MNKTSLRPLIIFNFETKNFGTVKLEQLSNLSNDTQELKLVCHFRTHSFLPPPSYSSSTSLSCRYFSIQMSIKQKNVMNAYVGNNILLKSLCV